VVEQISEAVPTSGGVCVRLGIPSQTGHGDHVLDDARDLNERHSREVELANSFGDHPCAPSGCDNSCQGNTGVAFDALHRNPNLMAVDVGKQVDLAGSSPELLGQRGSSWWTGKAPASTPGYSPDSGTVSALPSPALDTLTLSQIQDYFDNTWTLTEILFSSIQGARDARAQVVPG
jgi:hypothetical protein